MRHQGRLFSRVSPALLSLCLIASSGCTTDNPQGTDGGGGDLARAGTDSGGGNSDLGGGGNVNLTGGGQTVDAACGQLSAAVCAKLNACSPYLLQYYYGDSKTCQARVTLTCAPYVNLSGSSWTVARLNACAAGYASGTCDDYFAPGGPPACRPQAGTLADGAACANSNQCQSAHCSAALNGCGTCTKVGAVGDACSVNRPCGLGLDCTAAKCALPAQKGEACGTGQGACGTGLYCSAGKCAATLQKGEACTMLTGECDANQGLYCDPLTRKCAAYTLAAAGATCGAFTTVCEAGGTCGGPAATRKCVAAAADGAQCNAFQGPSCMDPAACTGGTCKVFDPATCK